MPLRTARHADARGDAVMALAWACMATGLYVLSLGPFFALVDAEHLTPRWWRELPLTFAALRLCLGGIA